MKLEKRLCNVYHKPLEIRICWECGGKDEVGHLFWKDTCSKCKGSGIEYYCPNWYEHYRSSRRTYSPPTTVLPDRSTSCPRCGGLGYIFNPLLKKFEPCPICGKKETSYQQSSPQQSPPESYGDIDGDGVPDAYDLNPFGPG